MENLLKIPVYTMEDIMRKNIPNWENMTLEEQKKARELRSKAIEEENRKEKEAEEKRIKDERRNSLLLLPRYRTCKFETSDNDNSAFKQIAKKYVDNLPELLKLSAGICFTGNVGVGKTHMLACMANEVIDKYNKSPLMATLSELITRLLNNQDNWTWNYAKTCSILFLDDFGVERQTDFVLEKTFELLDARTQLENAITVVSSNIDKNEFDKEQNDLRMARIYSRFKQLCPEIKTVKGSDRRGIVSEQKKEVIKKILGEA